LPSFAGLFPKGEIFWALFYFFILPGEVGLLTDFYFEGWCFALPDNKLVGMCKTTAGLKM